MLLIRAEGQRLCSGEIQFAVFIGFWFKDVLFLKSPVTTMHSHVGSVLFSLGSYCRLDEQVASSKHC